MSSLVFADVYNKPLAYTTPSEEDAEQLFQIDASMEQTGTPQRCGGQ